jgi:hypothetical protein
MDNILQLAVPGQLVTDGNLPKGFRPVVVGIGMYPAAVVDEAGDTYVAKAFVIDGYEVGGATINGKEYEYPDHQHEALYRDTEFMKTMKVPAGYELFNVGMNDTAEGGYIIYTNGEYLKERVAFYEADGDLWVGSSPTEWELKKSDFGPTFEPWEWTVFADQ